MSVLITRVQRLIGCAALCCACACLSGCGVEDLDVAYVYVPEVIVDDPTGTPAAQRVVAVRVVLDATSLGFYPLPARIPILGTGATRRLRLEPVVNRSGLSEEFVAYPLFGAVTLEQAFAPETVDTITPLISYLDLPDARATFEFVEPFTGLTSGFPIDLDGDAETALELVVDASTGERVGRVTLTETNPLFEAASVTLPAIPDARELWLELEYRGSATLTLTLLPEALGSFEERAGRYNQGALPRDDFRKFYFDLRNEVNDRVFVNPYRIGLLASYNVDAAEAEQEVYIDNVRLVYR